MKCIARRNCIILIQTLSLGSIQLVYCSGERVVVGRGHEFRVCVAEGFSVYDCRRGPEVAICVHMERWEGRRGRLNAVFFDGVGGGGLGGGFDVVVWITGLEECHYSVDVAAKQERKKSVSLHIEEMGREKEIRRGREKNIPMMKQKRRIKSRHIHNRHMPRPKRIMNPIMQRLQIPDLPSIPLIAPLIERLPHRKQLIQHVPVIRLLGRDPRVHFFVAACCVWALAFEWVADGGGPVDEVGVAELRVALALYMIYRCLCLEMRAVGNGRQNIPHQTPP